MFEADNTPGGLDLGGYLWSSREGGQEADVGDGGTGLFGCGQVHLGARLTVRRTVRPSSSGVDSRSTTSPASRAR